MNATIVEGNEEKGTLTRDDNNEEFHLQTKAEGNWALTLRIDGIISPFSIGCYTVDDCKSGAESLVIKNNLFDHHNNLYSIGEARPAALGSEMPVDGARFICRLVNFPYFKIDEIDLETRSRLRRHQGIPVGEIYGLGAVGYHTKIYGNELSEIDLPLCAATYILYTSR
jgi:hypothetical protein